MKIAFHYVACYCFSFTRVLDQNFEGKEKDGGFPNKLRYSVRVIASPAFLRIKTNWVLETLYALRLSLVALLINAVIETLAVS